MPIIVNLDVMLAKRKMRSRELAERIGITEVNVSLLKSGKVRGIRFETLEKLCEFCNASRATCWNFGRRARANSPPPHRANLRYLIRFGSTESAPRRRFLSSM